MGLRTGQHKKLSLNCSSCCLLVGLITVLSHTEERLIIKTDSSIGTKVPGWHSISSTSEVKKVGRQSRYYPYLEVLFEM